MMSRSEIREFFFKEGVIHFDETPSATFNLDKDLDASGWSLFARRARIPEDMTPATALENLRLLKDKKVTQAGVWLLASDITRFNISGNVSCALFMGLDKTRILDRKDFSGDVYSMIDSVMSYILSKINTELIIQQVKRIERPEIPEKALREAVVNALAHRDYRSTANTQVYIFKDRIEIVSPGGLPAGMTEADLGEKSIPRNPLLFSILYRMNAVEHIGSGIKRIHKACKDYGLKTPVMRVSENWITFVFQRPLAEKYSTEQVAEQVAEQVTEQVAEQVTEQVTEQVEKLIQVLKGQTLTSSEIMSLLGLSHRPTFSDNYLRPALESGLVEMTIPDKPTSRLQKYRFVTEQVAEQVTEQVTEQVKKLIQVLKGQTLTSSEIMSPLGLSHRPTFSDNYLRPALESGLVEMTIPDKPTSRLQKYRLTMKGKRIQSAG